VRHGSCGVARRSWWASSRETRALRPGAGQGSAHDHRPPLSLPGALILRHHWQFMRSDGYFEDFVLRDLKRKMAVFNRGHVIKVGLLLSTLCFEFLVVLNG
jgi:hypothetical protein